MACPATLCLHHPSILDPPPPSSQSIHSAIPVHTFPFLTNWYLHPGLATTQLGPFTPPTRTFMQSIHPRTRNFQLTPDTFLDFPSRHSLSHPCSPLPSSAYPSALSYKRRPHTLVTHDQELSLLIPFDTLYPLWDATDGPPLTCAISGLSFMVLC